MKGFFLKKSMYSLFLSPFFGTGVHIGGSLNFLSFLVKHCFVIIKKGKGSPCRGGGG